MEYSRRDLSLWLPLLAVAKARAQSAALPSKTYKFEEIPVQTSGENRLRPLLDGTTHDGVRIEVHETELPPGAHPIRHIITYTKR